MNDTYKTITNLIASAINDEDFLPPEGTDWDDVFTEMDKQKVAGLIGSALPALPINDELKTKWRSYLIAQRMMYEKILAEQDKLFRLLKGIPAIIIKGTSAAIYYPEPLSRTMGDIDVLVAEGYHDKAREILMKEYCQDNGFELKHTVFKNGAVIIELHKYAMKIAPEKQAYYDSLLIDAIPRAEKCEINGVAFPMLPRVENGIVILQHMSHHLQDGIGLRHVVDWIAYVKSSEEIDWARFNEISKTLGIFKFQCVLTKTCEVFLGLKHRQDTDWCSDIDHELCTRLMEYVISRGNFGMASDTYAGKFAMENIGGNIFKRLQMGGLCRWKAAAKYKFLRPFAWLYQGIRIIHEMLGREDFIDALGKDFKEADKVKKLMTDMGLDILSAS